MVDVILGLSVKETFSYGLVHHLVFLNDPHLDLSDRRLLKVILLNPQLVLLYDQVVEVHISINFQLLSTALLFGLLVEVLGPFFLFLLFQGLSSLVLHPVRPQVILSHCVVDISGRL